MWCTRRSYSPLVWGALKTERRTAEAPRGRLLDILDVSSKRNIPGMLLVSPWSHHDVQVFRLDVTADERDKI